MGLLRIGDKVKFKRQDILGKVHHEVGIIISEKFCSDNSLKVDYHVQEINQPFNTPHLRLHHELEPFENRLFEKYLQQIQSILKNE